MSCFDNGYSEFIVPEHLYIWRMSHLESAINACDGDYTRLDLSAYFTPGENQEGHNTEDAELIPYNCKVVGINGQDEDEFHFQRCGFNSIKVKWDTNDDEDLISPWELTLASFICNPPAPPMLHENEKAALLKIIDKQEENRQIRVWFTYHVNANRYTDYLNMIEIPMDMIIIRKRLMEGYYTNKLSVIADMKTIRDNCIKYNDTNEEISVRASELYETFKELANMLPEYTKQQQDIIQEVTTGLASPSTRSTRRNSVSSDYATAVDPTPTRSACLTREHTSVEESLLNSTAASLDNSTPVQPSPTRRSARLSRREHDSTEESSFVHLQAHSINARGVATTENFSQPSVLETLPSQPGDTSRPRRRRLSVERTELASSPTAARATRSSALRNALPQEEQAEVTSDSESSGESENDNDEREEALFENNLGTRDSSDGNNEPTRCTRQTRSCTQRVSGTLREEPEKEDRQEGSYICTRKTRSRSFNQVDSDDDDVLCEQGTRRPRSPSGKKATVGRSGFAQKDQGHQISERTLKKSPYEDVGSSDFNSDDTSDEESIESESDAHKQEATGKGRALRHPRKASYEDVGSSDFDPEDVSGEEALDTDLEDEEDDVSVSSDGNATTNRGGRSSRKKRKGEISN